MIEIDGIEYQGYCPICEGKATFRSKNAWHRDYLICMSCDNTSIPRERALALVLNETRPNWRELKIHESSPNDNGISKKLRLQCNDYTPSQFYPGIKFGDYVNIYRNEDLQKLTFLDNSFDIFLSLDVFEHIFNPQMAIKEIYRTLKPGGIMISTWPIRNYLVKSLDFRAFLHQDGTIVHLKEPEIHGNPADIGGSLVTVDYGYDIHKLIGETVPFDVRIIRFNDKTHGITGDYTDVIVCQK